MSALTHRSPRREPGGLRAVGRERPARGPHRSPPREPGDCGPLGESGRRGPHRSPRREPGGLRAVGRSQPPEAHTRFSQPSALLGKQTRSGLALNASRNHLAQPREPGFRVTWPRVSRSPSSGARSLRDRIPVARSLRDRISPQERPLQRGASPCHLARRSLRHPACASLGETRASPSWLRSAFNAHSIGTGLPLANPDSV